MLSVKLFNQRKHVQTVDRINRKDGFICACNHVEKRMKGFGIFNKFRSSIQNTLNMLLIKSLFRKFKRPNNCNPSNSKIRNWLSENKVNFAIRFKFSKIIFPSSTTFPFPNVSINRFNSLYSIVFHKTKNTNQTNGGKVK